MNRKLLKIEGARVVDAKEMNGLCDVGMWNEERRNQAEQRRETLLTKGVVILGLRLRLPRSSSIPQRTLLLGRENVRIT